MLQLTAFPDKTADNSGQLFWFLREMREETRGTVLNMFSQATLYRYRAYDLTKLTPFFERTRWSTCRLN